MYRTKKDVDKHVQDINHKIKSPTERALKGYFIAKLYFQVGDNESARKYIEGYLAEKDSHVMAHKLAGQIYQALKQTERALNSYKTCYQLDTSQKDVLETVCQLLLDLPIDPGRTKYWIEQAEKSIPSSNILYRLKEALVSKTDGETSKEFESMLLNEISCRQTDVNLRIRLIRYYQRVGRIKDGYEYALKCESGRPWPTSSTWYTTITEILDNYQVAYRENLGTEFYGLCLSSLDSALNLEIMEDAVYSRLTELLAKMDKVLQEADSSPVPPEKAVLKHFQAQFYFHAARLMYNKLTKDSSPKSMKEHHRTLGAALLAAYSLGGPGQDVGGKWSHLAAIAALRRSVSSHCLISLADKFGGLETYKERLAANVTTKGLNTKIANLIFVSAERRQSVESAGFLTSSSFPLDLAEANLPDPGSNEISQNDCQAVEAATGDLNTLAWILLRYYQPGKVLDLSFPLPGLQGLAEIPGPPYHSVSNLDANCFIYAVVYGAGYLEEDRKEDYLVPPYIGARLVSSNQVQWWQMAGQAASGTISPQDKRTLQFGLDAIRCKGLHGLDAQLLLKLGKTYECHALESAASADSDEHAHKIIAVLEARAALYFKAALSAIEKLEAGVSPRVPLFNLFSSGGPEPTSSELVKMRESAIFFLGTENMHQGLMEEALTKFKQVKTAYASFYCAEIYRKLADEEKCAPGVQVSAAYLNYLTEARDCLYLTLDRLKNEPSGHALNANIGDLVEEVENLIHESEGAEENTNGHANNRLGDHLSSTPRHLAVSSLLRRPELSVMANSSSGQQTPANRSLFEEREAKPSPERLDAQIRQLNHTQENLVRQMSGRESELVDTSKEILDTLKTVLDTNKEILSASKQSNTDIKEKVQDLKIEVSEIKKLLGSESLLMSAKFDKMCSLLQKIADKPVSAPAPAPAPSTGSHQTTSAVDTTLSEEEKLLLESFGVGSTAAVMPPTSATASAVAAAAAAAYNPLLNLQQQHLMMLAAAAQRPIVPSPTATGMLGQPQAGAGLLPGLYPQSPAPTFGAQTPGGVQLPTIPAPLTGGMMSSGEVHNITPTAIKPQQPQQVQQPQTVIMNTPKANKPVETGPPSNVVISKSDKIPTGAPAPIVSMSVTVPPQHRLGVLPSQTTPKVVNPIGVQPSTPATGGLGVIQPTTPQSVYKTPVAGGGVGTPVITPSSTPNSFQIKMPEGSALVTSSPFDRPGSSQPTPITTTAILSSIPTPKYSAVTPSPEKTATGQRTPGTTPKTRLPSTTEEPEEYEPQVDFKPVIPLPEEVEVVTGEENEEILWEDRAKLFRFANETKEWKERGLGQAKILKNKENGRIRFLMRREQTLKVCANHLILPTIKLDKMKGNAKARIWAAQDYADEEPKTESFCIRMKTEEQVEKFESVFLDAVKNASTVTPKKVTPASDSAKEVTDAPTSLAAIAAAQKAGSWECQGCLTRNDNSKIQCLACESAKPGCEEEVAKLKEAAKPVISIGPGGGFKFGSGTSSTTATSGSGFSFGSPAATAATTTVSFGTPSSSAIGFGGSTGSPAPSFGSLSGSLSQGTPKTSQPVKTLGGFTFTSNPTVQKEEPAKEKEAEKTSDTAKPNIFSGFSFGTKVEPVGEGKEDKPVLGGNTSVSFASIASASGGETSGFKTNTDGPGFSTSGNVLFSSQQKKSGEEGGDGGEGAEGEFEPDVDFKPVVPLPDLVEVKTGEEDEDAIFSERSKLFRFASETKEWKERGIGEFKILKNRKTGRIRFLMRREQVHKLCCNHMLTPEMEMKLLSSSDKAYTWTAQDYAEGELKTEVFCLRFKTPDLAKSWKEVVDNCQKELKDIKPEVTEETKPEKTEIAAASSAPKTLADFAAAQKAGSWECQGCLTRNDNAKIQCLACESAKPGCEEEVAKMKEAAKPVITIGAGGGFKFGSGSTTTAPAADSTSSGFTFGSSSTAPGGGGFSFKSSTENSTGSGFSFGTPTNKKEPASNGQEADKTVKSPFGTKDPHQFSFSGIKTSPRKHNESTTSETDLFVNEDEGEHIYFEPVIPLPDKVDVKTGEEDELVLYSQRSKLFRFVDGEWKERGLGDIKILKNEDTGKVRLLMRREQVLKICLNHYVTPQLISGFKEKDPKSWCWGAQDFSEGQLETMSFSIRFKTPDIASEFKKALDASMEGYVASPGKPGGQAPTSSKPKESDKTRSSKSPDKSTEEEELYKIADFRPLSPVDQEHELSFADRGLKLNTEEDSKDVWTVIRDEKDMHILTLAGNTVGIEAAKAIGHALENHPEFRRAHWKDMFTGRMKTEIPPALINLTRGIMLAQARLVELDLSDNAFGPVGMEGLVTFLKSPSCFTLQELRLNNTGCGVTGGKMLAKLLIECYNRSVKANHPLALKVFVLGRSRQENGGATALAEVFKMMGSLEEVVMPQNGIYYEGLTALADAFSNNPNLRILNLNDNTFTAKGAKVMAKALRKLNKLEILNLGDCLLKSAGAKHIARALKGRHPDLRELILDSNEIRIAGGLEVLDAIQDKENLSRFSMDCNCFGEAGEQKLRTKMQSMGKPDDLLAPMEDNEEPDEDEEDPDVSQDEEEDAAEPEKSSTASISVKPASALFGSSSSSSGPAKNLFGGSSSNSSGSTSTLFGAPKSEASPSLFGGNSQTTSTFSFGKSGSIFEGTKTEGSSMFGGSKTDNSTSSPFGGAKTEGSSIFGGSGNNNSGLFGGSATPSSKGTIFGGSATNSPSSSSIFGGTGSEGIFGNKSTTNSPFSGSTLFGKATESNSIFGSKPAGESPSIFGSSNTSSPSGATLFGKPNPDSTTQGKVLGEGASSFASIAASSNKDYSFGQASAEGSSPFSTAGNVLFSRNKTTPKTDGGDEDGDQVEDNEHDPHFEPIVPLPELVDVKTGEEEEEIVFKHRAKVYRHDEKTKEWKERGVGDIKILHNSERGTYRVLLRREQVHKVALNHLITVSMEISPMKNSETALCWYATDYSEGCEQGELAMLAVRFKTKETSEEFKAKFKECQAALSSGKSKTGSSTAAATSSSTATSSSSGQIVNSSTGAGADYDDEEGEEDEDDDETREEDMFCSEGFMAVKEDGGDWGPDLRVYIRIAYDEDLYGCRIIARDLEADDTENDLCDHLIAMQTNLTEDLEWSGLDYSTGTPLKKSFRIKFDSEEDQNDFKDHFAQGKEFADQCGISETETKEVLDPENLVYGVGGDD